MITKKYLLLLGVVIMLGSGVAGNAAQPTQFTVTFVNKSENAAVEVLSDYPTAMIAGKLVSVILPSIWRTTIAPGKTQIITFTLNQTIIFPESLAQEFGFTICGTPTENCAIVAAKYSAENDAIGSYLKHTNNADDLIVAKESKLPVKMQIDNPTNIIISIEQKK